MKTSKDFVKLHIEIFGKTLAIAGMIKDHEYAADYPLYLISNDGLRWMIDKYLDSYGSNSPDVGKILDRLNQEYDDYIEWTDENRAKKKQKNKRIGDSNNVD